MFIRLVGISLMLLMLQGCASVVVVGAVGGTIMANDERSITTQLNDTDMDFDISAALSKQASLKSQTHINAITMNTNVLLVGQAPNSMLRDQAVKAVTDLKIAKQIHNQIRIGNPTSFTTRSNDSWITTKVKSRMLKDKKLDMTRVKVVTENGEVFLLGLVEKEQADLAVDIARNTSGVRRVIKVFEIISN
ncbi:division/outer membrane stress-associated lipid-binding lipoprotein [Shewanella gelidii]|uniref:BON domain-containing protein n=1 Tax=Shewanella gelidii TaxID=1642821 RepID=A0A917NED9_9GAMM|nr:division/outer membrane stress-associated lipid-binding lipoprotein [Shewanella gelidii]MCL1099588.1 divisome-associated lipoprotein YraP [Shewanella gelidii]GGI92569.1 BON domain-containing protein [Shewanella gelidii]